MGFGEAVVVAGDDAGVVVEGFACRDEPVCPAVVEDELVAGGVEGAEVGVGGVGPGGVRGGCPWWLRRG